MDHNIIILQAGEDHLKIMICIITRVGGGRGGEGNRGWIKERDARFPCVYLIVGGPGASPAKTTENQECRRSHLRSFCNTI